MTDRAQLRPDVARLLDPPPSVVMIDGRSGAGKTTLAAQIADELEAQVLHMDDLYRGWDGLLDAPARLETALAEGTYHTYDWDRGRPAHRVMITADRPLVIEGCGSITAGTVAAAHAFAAGSTSTTPVLTLWMECPTEERKVRALARDGDMFRPHWDEWAAQEDALLRKERSRDIADVRLDALALPDRPDGVRESE